MPKRSPRQDKVRKLSSDAIEPTQPRSAAPQENTQSLAGLLNSLISEAKTIIKALPESAGYPNPKFENHAAKIRDIINELISTSHLEDAVARTREGISKALEGLPNKLQAFCNSNNFNLYGAFPDHIINGTTYLTFDVSTCRVTVNDATFPLFPIDALFLQISKEILNRKKRSFQADKFLEDLWNGYLRVLMNQGVPKEDGPGKRVSIYSLLPELAMAQQPKGFLANPIQRNFKSYSQHALRADLYLLLTNYEIPAFQNHRLKLEPSSVAEHGIFMYLPSLGRCAFIGHLIFE